MASRDFPYAILAETSHRPWPMPRRPWVMTQTWHDVLFAHWPVDPTALAPTIPSPFALDLFDGRAWIGIVPFSMTNVAPRAVPALPWLSEFAEVNVRTYVRAEGRPGVYFFSLDAANPLAVVAARTWLSLPYYTAAMRVGRSGESVEYESRRRRAPLADFAATYRPIGPVFHATPGSLDWFLTERYCLYARDHRLRPYRLEIHHPPWPLQRAEAAITRNSMAAAAGIELPAAAPLLHFARRQDVVVWTPERLRPALGRA
jgi:uncharacterized protein YqjF (DUF2071 family)